MTSQFIAELQKQSPTLRCFAIAADELARQQSEKAARALPRLQRKQAARHAYLRWKRAIDQLCEAAPDQNYEAVVAKIESLPLNAVKLTFDAAAVDEQIDRMAEAIRPTPTMGIGIWEQFVTPEVVLIWLWADR